MATYETIVRETDRFPVFDALARPGVVIERSTFRQRLSIKRNYEPVRSGVSYGLDDGRPLLRLASGEFVTEDGRLRFVQR